jgi:predicted lipoprotein with Yx(FWY)xxD motif
MKKHNKSHHNATPHVYKAVVGGSKQKANLKATGLVAAAIAAVLILGIGIFAIARHDSYNNKKQPAATAAPKLADNTSPTAETEQQNLTKSSTAAVTNSVLSTHSFAAIGQYLADPAGNALYTYGKDTSTTSNCTGSCAATWPAYEAAGTTGSLPTDVGTITHSDGKKQYTYKGQPLYYYQVDQQSGGVNGDGLNNFHVAKP